MLQIVILSPNKAHLFCTTRKQVNSVRLIRTYLPSSPLSRRTDSPSIPQETIGFDHSPSLLSYSTSLDYSCAVKRVVWCGQVCLGLCVWMNCLYEDISSTQRGKYICILYTIFVLICSLILLCVSSVTGTESALTTHWLAAFRETLDVPRTI
jgi:hypothetical protein